jgi:hypothetical protein
LEGEGIRKREETACAPPQAPSRFCFLWRRGWLCTSDRASRVWVDARVVAIAQKPIARARRGALNRSLVVPTPYKARMPSVSRHARHSVPGGGCRSAGGTFQSRKEVRCFLSQMLDITRAAGGTALGRRRNQKARRDGLRPPPSSFALLPFVWLVWPALQKCRDFRRSATRRSTPTAL